MDLGGYITEPNDLGEVINEKMIRQKEQWNGVNVNLIKS